MKVLFIVFLALAGICRGADFELKLLKRVDFSVASEDITGMGINDFSAQLVSGFEESEIKKRFEMPGKLLEKLDIIAEEGEDAVGPFMRNTVHVLLFSGKSFYIIEVDEKDHTLMRVSRCKPVGKRVYFRIRNPFYFRSDELVRVLSESIKSLKQAEKEAASKTNPQPDLDN